MIHTLYVDRTTTVDGLKKEFRKKLMTGGAVLRLKPELDSAELEQIFETFVPEAVRYSAAGAVLTELASHPKLADGLLAKLRSIPIPEIQHALDSRAR